MHKLFTCALCFLSIATIQADWQNDNSGTINTSPNYSDSEQQYYYNQMTPQYYQPNMQTDPRI